jgi:hypothetical protein
MGWADWAKRGARWAGHIGAGIATGGASVPASIMSEAGALTSELANSPLRMVGTAAGSAADTAALNRGVRAAVLRDVKQDQEDAVTGRLSNLESQLLARQAETRAARSDALRNLLRSDAILNQGSMVLPEGIPAFDFGLQPVGARARSALEQVLAQSQGRLSADDLSDVSGMPAYTPLDPYQPLMEDKKLAESFRDQLTPSKWEKAGNAAAVVSPFMQMILDRIAQGREAPITRPILPSSPIPLPTDFFPRAVTR